jgi:hypothetical protein
MEFAERESDSVEFEPGHGALDVLGVPGLLDGLRSVLEQRACHIVRWPGPRRYPD